MRKFDSAGCTNTLEENRQLLSPGNVLKVLRSYFAFNANDDAIVLQKGDIIFVLRYSESIIFGPIVDRMQIEVEVLYGDRQLSLEMFFIENTEEPWKKVKFDDNTVLVPNLSAYFTIFYSPSDLDGVY